MKIGFFELEGWEEKIIRETFRDEDVFTGKDKITAVCLPDTRDFEIISVFIDSRIDKVVLDCFPNLKCIATRSTGYDHIDVAECKRRGITVLYVPGYGDNTVAEYTFGILLALSRKICDAHYRVREEGSFKLDGLRGFDLMGKTLGIIGTGRIGRHVVRIAKGFEMKVLAYDPRPDEKFAKEAGFEYLPLAEVLKASDIVTLHMPYTKETHHLMNTETIAQMKQGAYLINTARGGVVETDALVKALKSGRLGGAALDVLEEEGAIKDELDILVSGRPEEHDLKTILENHILIDTPNVLITPHNAFNSQEALQRILRTTLDNIKSYAEGKPINIAT